MIVTDKEIQDYKLPSNFSIQNLNGINLIDYAYSIGYSEASKNSAKSVILKNPNTGDKVLVYKNQNNQGYISTIDDNEKGKLYHFILNRLNHNMVIKNTNPSKFEIRKVFVIAAMYLNTPQPKVSLIEKVKEIKPTPKLGENLNVKPLLVKSFLKDRAITNNTLISPKFKNHILNAYAPGKVPGTFIPNIAFPLYNSLDKDKITGYEIRNNNFKSFNGNHNDLWHSNIPENLKRIDKISFSESAIDCISHYQLHKKENDNTVYYSFSGNLYKEKMDNLIKSIEPILKENPNVKLESLTDKDTSGVSYDFNILTTLINKFQKGIHIEFNTTKDYFDFHIHNENDDLNKIYDVNLKELKDQVGQFNSQLNNFQEKATAHQRKTTLDLRLLKGDMSYVEIFNYLAKKYLPTIKIESVKPKLNFKDWNEQLQKEAVTPKKNRKI